MMNVINRVIYNDIQFIEIVALILAGTDFSANGPSH